MFAGVCISLIHRVVDMLSPKAAGPADLLRSERNGYRHRAGRGRRGGDSHQLESGGAMADRKSSQRMTLAQILFAIGMFGMIFATLMGVVTQGSDTPRYVALVAALFIAAGGVAALMKKLAG
jgi:hypothetical protein